MFVSGREGPQAPPKVQIAIVGDVVEISSGGEVLRTHLIRHDRSREHGAFANPGGRPRRKIGHFGTGDLEIALRSLDDLERAKPLIVASYEAS